MNATWRLVLTLTAPIVITILGSLALILWEGGEVRQELADGIKAAVVAINHERDDRKEHDLAVQSSLDRRDKTVDDAVNGIRQDLRDLRAAMLPGRSGASDRP